MRGQTKWYSFFLRTYSMGWCGLIISIMIPCFTERCRAKIFVKKVAKNFDPSSNTTSWNGWCGLVDLLLRGLKVPIGSLMRIKHSPDLNLGLNVLPNNFQLGRFSQNLHSIFKPRPKSQFSKNLHSKHLAT